ncbi:Nucleoporin-like protein 2 [Coemansia sp. RSA 1822]|nr:Nucleoporin-like protein 2 [Coemansia sp. RSA 638]KAJ2541240.1 Nucleoporin-like protein 2 [Coemansia sp. RSA 1853]KAJ2561381.1 Nucleoporin-like protein 2 [Coemansia sp. RSA 1822]
MTVCQYFLQGRCSFGDRCRNEHPQKQPSGFGQSSSQSFGSQSTNRFSGFSGAGNTGGFKQTTAFGALGSSTQKKTAKEQQQLTGELLKTGIEDRPLWKFSVFGPISNKANVLSGTDISPEEMQLEFKAAEASGSVAMCQQKYAQLAAEMDNKVQDILNNVDSYAQQWKAQHESSTTQQNAFGQSGSAFGQAKTPAQSSFGQTRSAFGQPKTSTQSAFGQSNATGAFGQPKPAGAFGQPATTGAFGQPVTTSAFGQSKSTGSFGQPSTTGAFGQSNPTGAFGQPKPAGAFGQSNTTSAFGQFGKTGTSAFGSQGTSAFGNQGASAFGNQGTSAFGNQGTSAFGSQGTSAFGQAPAGPPNALVGHISGTTDPTYELTAQDIERFKAAEFIMGQIPEHPPTADLC